MSAQRPPPSRSFGEVAEAYDRARPSYPDDAVAWLVGGTRATVLELGAGTGKLTGPLHAHGHQVLATDPLVPMLGRLAGRVPVPHVAATAEQIPLRSRSVDVVVCGQSFHWFDHDTALPEIARVLRPGGTLAVAWNSYDESIPWVRRLKRLIGPDQGDDDRSRPMMETPYFGFVEEQQFRFWQTHTAATLTDLACSVSHVATMSEADRDDVLARVESLYADYGRGHDGMQLPWVTRCYRAVVRHDELPPEVAPRAAARQDPGLEEHLEGVPGLDQDTAPVARRRPPEDPGMQLIDFR